MKKLTIYIMLSLLLGFGYAQEKETPPAGGQPRNFSLPNKTVIKLDNGLTVVMVPFGVMPKVTVSLAVKTGNIHEATDEVWLADLLADLMKEGTTTKSAQDISLAAANMGGQVNVWVTPNQTFVSGEVLSEYGSDLVKLIGDVTLNPAFPESELPRLINDMKRNLSVSLSRPGAIASDKFNDILYGDHPYGNFYPTEAMLDSYTTAKVKEFYDKNFGAKRTTIYVAGVFDEQEITKALKETFSTWKPGPEVSYDVPQVSAKPGVDIIDRPGAPQSTLIMGLPVVSPSDKDYIPLSVTNYLLGGSFGSRITSNIREDKGYTYSPYSTIQTRYGAGAWYEQADVTTAVTGPSLKEISFEISKLAKEAPSAEELDGIKNYRAGVFVLQNSSPDGIINQLSFLDLYGLQDSYLTEYVKNVYAVTPEQVTEMTRKYIDYEKMTIVVVGDKQIIEKQIEDYQNEVEAH